ncbi:STAS domain-containing protein [soil metagenome]
MLHRPQTVLDHSECDFTEQWSGTAVIIGCTGELDMLTAPDLRQRIVAALEKRPSAVVVDLTRVDFLASHGMNVLVAADREDAAGIGFAVVADGPVTKRPMQLIGLTDVLSVHATVEDALTALGI